MSIEVFNGQFAAQLWADTYTDSLVEAGLAVGARDWSVKRTAWGVAFEISFATQRDWERFRDTDPVRYALDGAPDPKGGVLIYRGRSLDTGRWSPRKPRPRIGSGSAARALPFSASEDFDPFSPFPSAPLFGSRRLIRHA